MTPKEVTDFYGSSYKAAAKLGIPRGTIAAWISRGFVPETQQALIQIKSRGRLKMGPPYGLEELPVAPAPVVLVPVAT